VAVGRHHGNNVGHIENSLQLTVEAVDGSRDASVAAEDLVVNNRGERQSVKHLVALFPYVFTNLFTEAFYSIGNIDILYDYN
jgi:hypothetical protein